MGDGPGDSTATIIDQMGNANLSAINSPTIVDIAAVDCFRATAPADPLNARIRKDFALPDRTGANSNKTVFVNRFSAPGGYKTLSRGYLDPAHEEKSVYNVLPYRNLSVLDYGTFESASFDESISYSSHVMQFDEFDRGLKQRLMAHNARFGYDSVYSQYPAYYKVNRNRKLRVEDHYNSSFVTASVYDNWFSHRTTVFVDNRLNGPRRSHIWIQRT